MRANILTEHWLPRRSRRPWLRRVRRPLRWAAHSSAQPAAATPTSHEPDEPAQALVNALTTCIIATIRRRAESAGIRIHSIEQSVEGDIDLARFTGDEVDIRRWYRQLKIRVRVDGNADEEELEHLVRTSQHAVLAGVRSGIHWR